MKTKLIFLFFLFGGCVSVYAQIYQFQKTYSTTGHFLATDMRVTNDGGYIVVGYDHDTVTGVMHNLVFKTDAAGMLQWKQTYSDNGTDWFFSVALTNDSGYIFAGCTEANVPSGHFATFLVKTDALGNEQWTKTITDLYTVVTATIKQTSDGNFIMTGAADDSVSGSKVMLAKISSTGALMWANRYGGPVQSKESGLDVIETNDGGYAAIGYTATYGAGNNDVYVVKTDVSGNLQWTRSYGGYQGEYGYAISKVNNENSLLLFGSSNTWGPNFNDEAYLLKTDSAGNLLWSKTYSGSSTETFSGYSMVQSSDNTIYLLGQITKQTDGSEQYCLLRTDPSGNVMWAKKYTYGTKSEPVKIRETAFRGFAMAGSCGSFTPGKAYLIKTDSLGNSGCHENPAFITATSPSTIVGSGGMPTAFGNSFVPKTSQAVSTLSENTLCFLAGIHDLPGNDFSVSVFPNPFTTESEIIFDKPLPENCGLLLYDVFGKEVQHSIIQNNKAVIHRADLASGIYYWKIVSGEREIAAGKIIAE